MIKINYRQLSLTTLLALFIYPVTYSVASISETIHQSHAENRTEYLAPYTDKPIQVDGVNDESVWQLAPWQNLDHRG